MGHGPLISKLREMIPESLHTDGRTAPCYAVHVCTLSAEFEAHENADACITRITFRPTGADPFISPSTRTLAKVVINSGKRRDGLHEARLRLLPE